MLRDILREHADIPAAPDDVIQKAQSARRIGTGSEKLTGVG